MNNYTQEEAKAIVVSVLEHLIANKYPMDVFPAGILPFYCIPITAFEEIMAVWEITPVELVDKSKK